MAVHKITDENFKEEVINSEKPVLAIFSAIWCGPCQKMSSAYEEISEELSGIAERFPLTIISDNWIDGSKDNAQRKRWVESLIKFTSFMLYAATKSILLKTNTSKSSLLIIII